MPPQAMAKPLKGTLQHNLAPKNLVKGVGSFHFDPRVLEGRNHLFGRLGQVGTVLPELDVSGQQAFDPVGFGAVDASKAKSGENRPLGTEGIGQGFDVPHSVLQGKQICAGPDQGFEKSLPVGRLRLI